MERADLESSPGGVVVEGLIEHGWPWIVALAGVGLGYLCGARRKAKRTGGGGSATGLPDSQTLRRAVQGQLALQRRYHSTFSLCLFSASGELSPEDKDLAPNELCQAMAATLESCSRETELVYRHGELELAVLLPHTSLAGAVVFAERACDTLAARLQVAVHAGVTVVLDGDAYEALLKRADEALFLAQAAGPQQIFQHAGLEARRAESQSAATSAGQELVAHSERLDPNHAAAESPSLNPAIWSGASAAEAGLPAR
jgi:GGDEF domain-containing protein